MRTKIVDTAVSDDDIKRVLEIHLPKLEKAIKETLEKNPNKLIVTSVVTGAKEKE